MSEKMKDTTTVESVDVNLDEIFNGAPGADSIVTSDKEVKKPNFYNFFDTLHNTETKQYFGEDFGFCQRWRDMGGKVYLYIMDYITHVGEHQFCGRFFDNLKLVDDSKKIK